MRNIIKSAVIITLVVLFSFMIIFYAGRITFPYISMQEADRQNKTVESVLPEYTVSEKVSVTLDNGEKFSYWEGTKTVDGLEKKAFAFTSVIYGYNVDIKAIVGVDEENMILGISIFQQTETPGSAVRLIEMTGKETTRGAIHGKIFSRDDVTGSLFHEQFRGIELDKKILISDKGLRSQKPDNEIPYRNSITTITGATMSAKYIIDGLEENLNKLVKARLIHEQDLLIKQNLVPGQNKEEIE